MSEPIILTHPDLPGSELLCQLAQLAHREREGWVPLEQSGKHAEPAPAATGDDQTPAGDPAGAATGDGSTDASETQENAS